MSTARDTLDDRLGALFDRAMGAAPPGADLDARLGAMFDEMVGTPAGRVYDALRVGEPERAGPGAFAAIGSGRAPPAPPPSGPVSVFAPQRTGYRGVPFPGAGQQRLGGFELAPGEHDLAGELGAGIGRGALQMAGGLAASGDLLGLTEGGAEFGQMLARAASEPGSVTARSASVQAYYPPGGGAADSRRFRDPKWWAAGIGEFIPQIASVFATGGAAAAAGAGAIPTMLAGVAPLAAVEGGHAYTEIKQALVDQGADPSAAENVARIGGGVVGLVNGLLELVPASDLLTRSGVGQTILRKVVGPRMLNQYLARVGVVGVEGAVQEALQTGNEVVAKGLATGQWPGASEFRTAMLDAAVLGGLAEAGAAAVMPPVVDGRPPQEPASPGPSPPAASPAAPPSAPGVAAPQAAPSAPVGRNQPAPPPGPPIGPGPAVAPPSLTPPAAEAVVQDATRPERTGTDAKIADQYDETATPEIPYTAPAQPHEGAGHTTPPEESPTATPSGNELPIERVEAGAPAAVRAYHGTRAEFDRFEARPSAVFAEDQGRFFFSGKVEDAREYAEHPLSERMTGKAPEGRPRVVEARIHFRKPYVEALSGNDDPVAYYDEHSWSMPDPGDGDGFDGIIVRNEEGDSLVVAFDPSQIEILNPSFDQPAPAEPGGAQNQGATDAVQEPGPAQRGPEVRGQDPQGQEPAEAGAREALIERIVAAARKPPLEVVPVVMLEGTDGKWYRPAGFPIGVRATGQQRTDGYAYRTPDGTLVGTRHPTAEAAHEAARQRQQRQDEEFREALREMPDESLREQAAYWRVDAAPEPEPAAPPRAGRPRAPEGPAPARDADAEARRKLRELKAKRFKTAGDETSIFLLEGEIAADPSKWRVGDGVGYYAGVASPKRRGSQINRGFRISAIDAATKTATVVQVADTGLTTTGGDRDRIGPEQVHIADLVRDRKYDAPGRGDSGPEAARAGEESRAALEAGEKVRDRDGGLVWVERKIVNGRGTWVVRQTAAGSGVALTKGGDPRAGGWSKDEAIARAMELVRPREGAADAGPKPQAPADPKVRATLALAERIAADIGGGGVIDNKRLFAMADEAFGGTVGQGTYTPKDAYDAVEVALARLALQRASVYDPRVGPDEAAAAARALASVVERLPTPTRRTGEQESFQQFSTPPHYAYALAWAANIGPNDVVLEPSAGTGALAVHAHNARPREVVTNELSGRRADLLDSLGLGRVFRENAEQLNNVLPRDVRPTVVLMNPPFSQTAGRMGDKKVQTTGVAHVEQALKRLEPGGRLVAIVGATREGDTPSTVRAFIGRLDGLGAGLRANVGVGRNVYRKMGTTFPTRLLVIDKAPSDRPALETAVEDVPALIAALEGIRHDRQAAPAPPEGERGGDQPRRPEQAPGGRPDARPDDPARAPTGEVVPGRGPGRTGPGDRDRPAGPDRGPARVEPAGRDEGDGGTGGRGSGDGGRAAPADAGEGGQAPPRQPAPAPDREQDGVREGREPVLTAEQRGQRAASEEQQSGGATYEVYRPFATVPGAKDHPSELVQSAALAAVDPPAPTYKPSLPARVVKDGLLSGPQLEAIVYAGQAHEQFLENGARRGFFIGDGTGVGKGREIAGILLDNWNQGRTKAVWISEKKTLAKDARRDIAGIGWDPKVVFRQDKIASGEAVTADKGVLFTSYATLKSKPKDAKKKSGAKSRLEQIVDWVGPDFDGVIAFDEAHNMANAVEAKGPRGKTEPSATALAGVELQQRLPKARIVYVSATGATEVRNLAYAERLGLWGPGTPFGTVQTFISRIAAGGVASMELVASNLKAVGSYLARNLSFRAVTQDQLIHPLTDAQRDQYNTMADAWAIVLRNFEQAIEATAGIQKPDGTVKVDGKAKSAAMSAFWSANQRFWNQVITSMQMPSVLAAIEKDLEAGHAVVLQLVNTNEAQQERAFGRLEEDDDLEQLDMSPRDVLMELIRHSFPVQQYQPEVDANGNTVMRPVVDSSGKPVENAEAVEMREALLDRLGALNVGENPLDVLINHFGPEAVAEVTGRSRRVVRGRDGRMAVEKRGDAAAKADVQAFLDGRKLILVFSDKGGTGASYHADRTFKNQRKRVHYLIQPGWRADKAIQGLGRSHRSNQAHAPHFVLVSTDLNGQKRFLSTIARRLDQLGALTKGERRTGGQGLFREEDNLESEYARDALQRFYGDLAADRVPGLDLDDFETLTGLKLRDPSGGGLKRELPPISKFLNRLLSLKIDQQNMVFDAFMERVRARIQQAIDQGTFDAGVEDIRADRIEKVSDQVAHTDARSGATTRVVELRIANRFEPTPYPARLVGKPGATFYQNVRSGRVYFAHGNPMPHQQKDGRSVLRRNLVGPVSDRGWTEVEDLEDPEKWRTLPPGERAREMWDAEIAKAPEWTEHTTHLVAGALLPVWDRLPERPVMIRRARLAGGEAILGRVIPDDRLPDVLRRLGLGVRLPAWARSPEEVLSRVLSGYTARLANDWRLRRATVTGEARVEIIDFDPSQLANFRSAGLTVERVNFQTRVFVPTADAKAMADLLRLHEIVETFAPRSTGGGGGGPAGAPSAGTAGASGPSGTPSSVRRPARTLAGDPTPRVSAPEIIKAMSETVGVPFRFGHGRFAQRKVEGWFNRDNFLVRQRVANALNVAAHELGHAIHDKIVGWHARWPPGVAAEVTAMGKALYGKRKPSSGYRREGFAEYVARYLLGDDMAQAAPKTHRWFTLTILPAHERFAARFHRVKDLMDLWDDQGAPARVASQINKIDGGPVGALKAGFERLSWRWVRSMWTNDAAPLEDAVARLMVQQGRRPEDLRPTENPAVLRAALKMGSRGTAREFIFTAAVDHAGRRVGPSLSDVLQPVKADLEDFIVYAYARRAQVLLDRNINPGITRQDADATVAQLVRPGYEAAVQGLTEWSNYLIDYVVESGGLSREAADAIRAVNPIYLPLKRYFDQTYLGGRAGTGGGKGVVNVGAGIRRIKGSGRQIIDPLESFVQMAEDMISRGNKMRVARAIAELAEATPDSGWFANKVPPPTEATRFTVADVRRQLEAMGVDLDNADLEAVLTVFQNGERYFGKDNIVTLFRNGTREFWELDPDVFRVVTDLDADYLPAVLRGVFGAPARLVRLGATGLSETFAVHNFFSDAWTLAVYGRHGATPAASLRGLWAELLDKPEAERWRAAGGEMATFMGQDRRATKRALEEALARTPTEKGWQIVKHPIDALRGLFGMAESAPRIEEFRRAYAAAKRKRGYTEEDAVIEALLASKDVTTNFTRMGLVGGILNGMIPFFNARLQGASKFYRTFAAGPFSGAVGRRAALRATAGAIGWITLPTILLWLLNKDEEWYEELPTWRKYGFWNFSLDGGKTVWSIRRPFDLGWVFGSVPEAMLNKLYREDGGRPGEIAEVVLETGRSFLPIGSPMEAVPAALKPAVEAWSNYDSFRGRSIVSPFDERNRMAKDLYGRWTTETAKALGELVGVSPAKIEHMIGGYTGGLGLRVMRTTEAMIGLREDADRGLRDVPVVGAVVAPSPFGRGQAVDDLYREIERLRKRKGSKEATGPERARLRRLESAADAIAKMRDAIERGKLDEEKGGRYITNRARAALGRPRVAE